MNISLNFLKKFIELPADLSPEQIAYDLTMRTVEVESIIDTSKQFENIVVGKITKVSAHPNADTLRICQVDLAEDGIRQIVCGGSNLTEGHHVLVSKPGAFVVWHGEGEPVLIKETKLRGEPSYGMICAAEEVYLGDLITIEGERPIVDFDELGIKASVGQNLSEVLGLADTIFEIDNKSLTNRPDLWGHYGIARELSVIYNIPLKEISAFKKPDVKTYDVSVSANKACNRLTATLIDGVEVKESPLWMKVLISHAGMRPINALVDITNYVMLATGQPLHAYDSTHIAGSKLCARFPSPGEKLTLLDGKFLELNTDDLIIADESSPLGLAGIKGGKNDSILETTNSIVLEAGVFDASYIRRTSRRLDVKTDASIRYEKGIDTERIDLALSMAYDLFAEIFPDSRIAGFGDSSVNPTKRSEIKISKDFLTKRLGENVDSDRITDILTRLGYEAKENQGEFTCLAPTWRSTGDVSIRDDILGDIARIIGYENFSTKPIKISFDSAVHQIDMIKQRRIKEYLAFRCGLNEIFSYPWVNEKLIKLCHSDLTDCVRLAEPPAPETSYLRPSLVPGILAASELNSHNFENFGIFETAQIFTKGEYHPSSQEETLPIQSLSLSIAIAGQEPEELFYRIKGIISGISSFCHTEPIDFDTNQKPAWADNNAWLNIVSGSNNIGDMGLASLSCLQEAGIKHIFLALAELNLDDMIPLVSRNNSYTKLPEFPLVSKDISIVVKGDTKFSDIVSSIDRMAKSIEFVDEYRGEQVPDGFKSLSLRLTLGNDDSTMTTKQIDKKVSAILAKLQKDFDAHLREL